MASVTKAGHCSGRSVSTSILWLLVSAAMLLAASAASVAHAHPLGFGVVELTESRGGAVAVGPEPFARRYARRAAE